MSHENSGGTRKANTSFSAERTGVSPETPPVPNPLIHILCSTVTAFFRLASPFFGLWWFQLTRDDSDSSIREKERATVVSPTSQK